MSETVLTSSRNDTEKKKKINDTASNKNNTTVPTIGMTLTLIETTLTTGNKSDTILH